MKVYVLEAPSTALAVAESPEQARRWRDRLDEDPAAPSVTIFEMELGDPPNFQDGENGERDDG